MLMSLTGLENLDSVHGELVIKGKDDQSECAIESFSEYLNYSAENIKITDNAAGCSSVEEVENNCLLSTDQFDNSVSHLKLYPIPFKGNLYHQCDWQYHQP